MSKQTAVEWLEEKIKRKIKPSLENGFNILVEQAKAMEKEQIVDAYGDALNGHRVNYCNRNDYYNKTYKGGQDG